MILRAVTGPAALGRYRFSASLAGLLTRTRSRWQACCSSVGSLITILVAAKTLFDLSLDRRGGTYATS